MKECDLSGSYKKGSNASEFSKQVSCSSENSHNKELARTGSPKFVKVLLSHHRVQMLPASFL